MFNINFIYEKAYNKISKKTFKNYRRNGPRLKLSLG